MSDQKNMRPRRLVVYPKDVEDITGRSPQTARRLIAAIKRALGKTRDQFVTIRDFCLYYGMQEDLVVQFIRR
jgi:hypothetical protein